MSETQSSAKGPSLGNLEASRRSDSGESQSIVQPESKDSGCFVFGECNHGSYKVTGDHLFVLIRCNVCGAISIL